MSQFDFITIKKQLINGRDIRDFKQYFNNDEFALEMIKFSRKYLKYFEKYTNSKDHISFFLVHDKNYDALSLMSEKLKNDLDFAIEIFNIDKSGMIFFNDEIRNSEKMLNKYIEYIKQSLNVIYAKEIYTYKRDEFFDLIKNNNIYKKLPSELKYNKEVLVTYIESPHFEGDLSYTSLPNDITSNFQLNIKILSKTVKIEYKKLVIKNIISKIKRDKEKMSEFLDSFNGEYDSLIMLGLMQNKEFKNKYKDLLKEYPDEKDYRPYMRQLELTNTLNETKIEKKELPRKKI